MSLLSFHILTASNIVDYSFHIWIKVFVVATRFISHSLNNLLPISGPYSSLMNRKEHLPEPDFGHSKHSQLSNFPQSKITATLQLLVIAVFPKHSAPWIINSVLLFYTEIIQCWNDFFSTMCNRTASIRQLHMLSYLTQILHSKLWIYKSSAYFFDTTVGKRQA